MAKSESNSKNLTLFLNIKGQEVKKVLELDEFEAPLDIELIQSINGKQLLLKAAHITNDQFRANSPVVKNDEFIESLNALYESEANHKAEVKLQSQIEREWNAAQAEQDEKGRQKAYKLAQEEQQRLKDMKREAETQKYQKRSTISTKKSTR